MDEKQSASILSSNDQPCCSSHFTRRDFIAGAAGAGAAGLSVFNPAALLAADSIVENPEPEIVAAGGKLDIGRCRSVKITCISEIGWHDGAKMKENVKAGGGPDASQWTIPWDQANAAGSCSLLDIEALDGGHKKFLIDAGWNKDYMRQRFAQTGVDRQLASGEIDALFLTHEHMDHIFALELVLEQRRDIPIYIPSTFHLEACRFLAGAEFPAAGAKNAVTHTGRLIRFKPGGINRLVAGAAAVTFDMPFILHIDGEQTIYANVEGRGLVAITGCCHHTVPSLVEAAAPMLTPGTKLYGLYGGLHLAPMGTLAAPEEAMVREMGKYGFERIACNHCTGVTAVKLMTELGYPVVKGTGSNGSLSDLYVGNGDSVTFG
jgi:7,8-dihydropterin-6-yl-methyl-4-(beta-D-ribofuranosyl)aminobenzene 5'-phosphate synthase